jgi:hypothetical protein
MLRLLAIVDFVLAVANFAFFIADGHIYNLLAGMLCFGVGLWIWDMDARYRIRR